MWPFSKPEMRQTASYSDEVVRLLLNRASQYNLIQHIADYVS